MNYKIIPTDDFLRAAKPLSKKYRSFKEDLLHVADSLRENPTQGTKLTENCYKLRFSISSKNKGTSGSGRIITFVYLREETVYLLAVYDKQQYSNVDMKVIQAIIQEIEESQNDEIESEE